MNKKILGVLFLAAIFLLYGTFPCFADSSATQQLTGNFLKIWDVTATADAESGGYSAIASTWPIRGIVLTVESNAGALTLTDNWDYTITNDNGSYDIMGGAGANRDTADTERVKPTLSGSNTNPPVEGILTINISNNTQPGAIVRFKLYYIPVN